MASDPLDLVLAGLKGALSAVAGLERWYDEPPESPGEFPCALAYVSGGSLEAGAAGAKGLHRIALAILLCRPVLPEAVAGARVWPYRVLGALQADQSLGGSVATIVWPVTYQAGPLQWTPNEAPFYGVKFEIPVKVLSA